jgi:hypothetical protein
MPASSPIRLKLNVAMPSDLADDTNTQRTARVPGPSVGGSEARNIAGRVIHGGRVRQVAALVTMRRTSALSRGGS